MATAEAQARWRAKRAKAGFCITCGKRKARAGMTTCKKCVDEAVDRVQQARKLAIERCVLCFDVGMTNMPNDPWRRVQLKTGGSAHEMCAVRCNAKVKTTQ